jgi:hypothetical protein
VFPDQKRVPNAVISGTQEPRGVGSVTPLTSGAGWI